MRLNAGSFRVGQQALAPRASRTDGLQQLVEHLALRWAGDGDGPLRHGMRLVAPLPLQQQLGELRAWRHKLGRGRTCVGSKGGQTSASWLSGGLSQRQIVRQAAPSFGQPRPISRLGRAGTQATLGVLATRRRRHMRGDN